MPNGTEESPIDKHLAELRKMIEGPKADGVALKIHEKEVFLIGHLLYQNKGLSLEIENNRKIIQAQQRTIKDLTECQLKLEDANLIERTEALEANQVRPLPKLFWTTADNWKKVIGVIAGLLTLYEGVLNWEFVVKALAAVAGL
jgi:hypothetical protein